MIMLDSQTALVMDTDDLMNAVSYDNGVNYVYLGGDITLAYGVTIFPDKTELTISGTYNGVTYTFTDMDSADLNQTVGIRAASSINLTIRDINLVGRNYFGIPYVYEGVNTDNVTVTYNNVTYTGKQVIYHQRGLTRFIDCNITIDGQPSSQVEEVGQVCKVEIGGKTTIQKMNNEDSIFWFYGSSTRRPYLKILANADVTITTAHYFMFESYSPDYIIEPGASFALNTNSGISYTGSHTINSFSVGKNASFQYTQATNRASYASLYLDGALTVDEGANFYMQADFANSGALIRFTGGSASMNLNNPRSFALYNKGTATAFSFAATIPFAFSGNQINYWETPKDFPAAGTFDDIPLRKWRTSDWRQFKVAGRAGASQIFIDSHDFTQEELDAMPALTSMTLYLAKVFSVGNLPLSVNRIVTGTKRVTGKTAKKAKVRVLCSASWPNPDSDADDDGIFAAASSDPVPPAVSFTVTANTPFLLTTLTEESQEEGGLYIVDAPESIVFVTPPMAGFADVILPRRIPDIPVTVMDERANRTPWVIWARITGPLQTAENDILDDAVVFAQENGDLTTLSTQLVPVHTDGPYLDVDSFIVTWDADKGVLARITVPIRSGRRYSTKMGWVVYPAGVEPEDED